MKLVIATDHNGTELKKEIIKYLKLEYEVLDFSEENYASDDYPVFAFKVSEYISNNLDSLGILLCGTGIGMSIAANKVKNIRCAHISNKEEAFLARSHNNANIIAMSYKNDLDTIIKCIKTFITTNFSEEERHIRRINLISQYEKSH